MRRNTGICGLLTSYLINTYMKRQNKPFNPTRRETKSIAGALSLKRILNYFPTTRIPLHPLLPKILPALLHKGTHFPLDFAVLFCTRERHLLYPFLLLLSLSNTSPGRRGGGGEVALLRYLGRKLKTSSESFCVPQGNVI